MSDAEFADLVARETAAGAEHVAAGRLRHIWRVPGRQANVAIWACEDADALHAALASLPAWPWMTITVRPLATHPLSDRAGNGR
ncbi:MAG: muconolactone delta-isomerase [Actinobacteria bacterium]|nr:muconolactone delta-isomerase [Actinomycetota bacterium]